MKKVTLHICFFLLLTNYGKAQELPSIQTDRPDQTECPFITPKHFFQLENGFSYEKSNQNSEIIVAPTILKRFGINKFFELRLITEYVITKEITSTYSGIYPVLIGFKTRLSEEKGIIPATSLIAHIGFPKVASSQYWATDYYPEFRFAMQHTVNEKQSLSYNFGAEWDGENTKPTFIYTLATGYSLTKKIGAYVEFYGFFPQTGKADHRFDLGFTFLSNPNHQLDVSGGLGLSKTSPDYFLSLGYSFRFKI